MSKSTVELKDKALSKALAHTLKHSKSDCIGILLGQIKEN